MYNYRKFHVKEYDLLNYNGVEIGEVIPDFEIFTLDGEIKKISDYCNKPIILETGSISCGMFAGQIKNMEKLAKESPDFNFLVLYVREAHPGKKISPHSSINDKCSLANDLIKTEGVNRTIIIDDIEGSFHKKLGEMPNMVFIMDTQGKIVFKSNWNKASVLRKALNDFRNKKNKIYGKWTFLPMPSLIVEHRIFNRTGWDAALDLLKALPKLIYLHIIAGVCNKYPKLCKK